MDCNFYCPPFGLVGFVDDYLKIKKQNSDGLSRKQKLLTQTVGTLLICIWLLSLNSKTIGSELLIPFFKDLIIPLNAIGFLLIGWFAIVGGSNSVNLTDGLDGLAIMPVILISGALAVFAYIGGNYNFSAILICHLCLGLEKYLFCAQHLLVLALAFSGLTLIQQKFSWEILDLCH
jgi:phospho-N-acetylmuramoyl-pentapeptide-transferase